MAWVTASGAKRSYVHLGASAWLGALFDEVAVLVAFGPVLFTNRAVI
jgi:hypothetical protein